MLFKIFKSSSALCIWALLVLLTCNPERNHKVTPSFYHWKSSLDVSSMELEFLDSLNVSKLYVRFFDLDWDGQTNKVIPKGILSVNDGLPLSVSIVPTVYITNKVMLNISPNEIEALIGRVKSKILDISKELPNKYDELQFDCDWSEHSKVNYFSFLEKVRLVFSNKKISATIRLHQIKFFDKSGVPPVDKGMLMYYNMGDLSDVNSENSILNNKIGNQYLNRVAEYPITLDIAIPIFSWGVLYRDDKLIKLLNKVQENDLQRSDFQKIGLNLFKVNKSTFLYGTYLYENDIIRFENVRFKELQKASELLRNISNKELVVSFYHLDSILINQYEIKDIQAIYDSFSSRN